LRLQKYLADAGIASRRKCEEIILASRVTVNGEVAALGCVVEPDADRVELDGEEVRPAGERVVVLLHKPRGVMCTASDPQGRATIMEYIEGIPARLYSVGRLDFDSEGLIVMTNDGALAYRMTHPKFKLDKTYSAICEGELTQAERHMLQQGVLLEDGMTSPARVEEVLHLKNGNTACNITIHEGRTRQVRRMLTAVGHETLMLRRIRIGPLDLGALEPGKWRHITAEEAAQLADLLRT
jgi:pseudouridine synthase